MPLTTVQELYQKLQGQSLCLKPQAARAGEKPQAGKAPPEIKGPRAVQDFDQTALHPESQK